jgi:NADH-quinone oxidoreductase subunit L
MPIKRKYNQSTNRGFKVVLDWLKGAALFARLFVSDVAVFAFSTLAAFGLIKRVPQKGAVDLSGCSIIAWVKGIYFFFYLISFILIFVIVDDWHMFIVNFFVFELFLSVFIYVHCDFWATRILLAAYNAGALMAWSDGKDILVMHINNLHNWFAINYNDLVDFHNCLIALDNVARYYYNYFLIIFLPYYCVGVILLVPLAAALVAFSFGYLLGYVYIGYSSTCAMFLSFSASAYLFFVYPYVRERFMSYTIERGLYSHDHLVDWSARHYIERGLMPELSRNEALVHVFRSSSINLELNFGRFINSPFLRADFEFVFDSVSLIMVFTVTLISALVHLYSTVYMKSDPHAVRFFGLLSLFTFFMIVLVGAGNMVMLYVGWEGVGLSSFLLIAFWYTRVSAQKAAMKAILVNKIGDMFLILAIAAMAHFSKGATNFSAVRAVVDAAKSADFAFGASALDLMAVSLVLAAFVKSAQIFFHTWLPDAMEGPTPVSALLHAATMVTAGVYLVIRFSFIIEYSIFAKGLVLFGGFYTVIFSSLIALVQYDIKKIIAYSTCSQLGLMFFACGLSAYDLALYHFFNHAFFKCLLFLLAGAVIHELHNEQDIRKMGGLAKRMPATFIFFCIAGCSLAGLPSLSGAASKDLILLLSNFSATNSEYLATKFIFIASNLTIYLTVAYTARLVYYVFIRPESGGSAVGGLSGARPADVSRRENAYTWIFTVLSVISVVGGRVFKEYFIFTDGRYINIKQNIITMHPSWAYWAPASGFTVMIFFLTLTAFLWALCAALFIRAQGGVWFGEKMKDRRVYKIYLFFNKKGYFDEFYASYVTLPLLKLSSTCRRAVEDGLFKFFAVSAWRGVKSVDRLRLASGNYTLLRHAFFAVVGLAALILVSFLII